MVPHFSVEHLDIEKLLAQWRWLCLHEMKLIARNAFGDLFLCDNGGKVFRLDISAGKLTEVAGSEAEFRQLAETQEKLEAWFAVSDERAAAARGLSPNLNQCIGFAVPLAFRESGLHNTPFVVDIYQQIGFQGEMHRQLSALPEGAKVRLRVVP